MNKSLTVEQLNDATRFSNFAQRVKMKYWGKTPVSKVPEIYLDEILLLAWEDLTSPRA